MNLLRHYVYVMYDGNLIIKIQQFLFFYFRKFQVCSPYICKEDIKDKEYKCFYFAVLPFTSLELKEEKRKFYDDL